MRLRTRPPLLTYLLTVFPVGSEKREEYVYCGVQLRCIRGSDNELFDITLDQENYISEVAEIKLVDEKNSSRSLDEKEKTFYRGLIEALTWCTGQTRRNFSYAVRRLSERANTPTVADAQQANETLQQMKKRPLKLCYVRLQGPLRLIGYHDSSLGNGDNGKTVGGWIWTLASGCDGKRELFRPVSWKSRTLRRVVNSTITAETLACSAGR